MTAAERIEKRTQIDTNGSRFGRGKRNLRTKSHVYLFKGMFSFSDGSGSEKVSCVRVERSRYVRKRSQIRRFQGFGRVKTTLEPTLRSQFASRLRT